MKTELVRFQTSDGLTLEGLLFSPEVETNKVIVHVHGSAGNFYENDFIDVFSKRYTDEGYAFLSFNNRGAEYEREMSKIIGDKKIHAKQGMLHEIFEECIYDIDAAVNFCKKRNFEEFIISGHSLGCNKVVWYALEKNFQGNLILLAPCDLTSDANPEQRKLWEKARELIKQNKGHETLPNFWGQWNIAALTLISVWGEDVNADMFRYRDGKIVDRLGNLKNNILIEIGTKDQCIDVDKQAAIDYLKRSFSNAKVSYDLIQDVNHYKGKENELIENILIWLKNK